MKSGRLRAIAVTSTSRLASMAELPTVAEAGVKGYESSQWYGVLAPAGTPEEILNLLNSHVVKIVQSADMKQRLIDDGIVPVGNSRQQFAAYVKAELVEMGGRRQAVRRAHRMTRGLRCSTALA